MSKQSELTLSYHLPISSAAKSIIQVVSHVSSCSLEELNSVRQPGQPMMWQFYCT